MAVSYSLLREFLPPDIGLILLEEVDSTNDFAMRRAKSGEPGDAVIVARGQTGGKGTKGRSFYSPKDSGLYLSALLHTGRPFQELAAPTPAAAVAVCRGIESVTGLAPHIKWVNDILLDGKKVCGILTESYVRPENGEVSLIVGAGINISTCAFPAELAGRAVSIGSFVPDVDVNRLAAAVAAEMFRLIRQFDAAACMDEYRARSCVLGKRVRYTFGGAEKIGVARAITDEGHLLVEAAHGTDELRSADAEILVLN